MGVNGDVPGQGGDRVGFSGSAMHRHHFTSQTWYMFSETNTSICFKCSGNWLGKIKCVCRTLNSPIVFSVFRFPTMVYIMARKLKKRTSWKTGNVNRFQFHFRCVFSPIWKMEVGFL